MCDTVCAFTPGAVLFGKNSDREPGEAQAAEAVPVRSGLSGALKCTHLEVPQVSRTRAVLLSRPSWMWGCEMGANDAGVVGGNEAVFTHFPAPKDGLTGMDLLRLGLERGGSAREVAQVVIELLAAHPQGGRMGFRNTGFRYHSSVLFADAREAWVLETAGAYWALESRVVDSPDVAAAWETHRDAVTRWLAAVEAAPASRTAPVFRAWWRKQSRLDFEA